MGFPISPHTLPQNENLHNKSHFNELTSQVSVETELKAKQSSTSSIWESLGRRPTVAQERGCYQLLSPLYKGTLQSPKTGQCLCKIQKTDTGTGNRVSTWRQTAVCLEKPAPMKLLRRHWLVQTRSTCWTLVIPGMKVSEGVYANRSRQSLKSKHWVPCPHLPQHRFEGHGPQSCGENLASFPKCETLEERKRLRFLLILMIVFTQLHVFALILQYLYVNVNSEGQLKTRALRSQWRVLER